MRIPFILTDEAAGHVSAHRPHRATRGAAGYDLTAATRIELVPHARELVDTGIAIEIPEGYAGLILPRSGLALKKGLTVLNAPGLIDSDYRGNLKVLLWNSNGEGKVETVSAGDKIAQLVIVKVEDVEFSHAAYLSHSARGDGGFGSTDTIITDEGYELDVPQAAILGTGPGPRGYERLVPLGPGPNCCPED